jgi:cellobiose phosphorylase
MASISDYGRFLEKEQVFELRSDPPRRWANRHQGIAEGTSYSAEVTNTGSGASRVVDKDGSLIELIGPSGKYLYVRDETTKKVFCPWGAPTAEQVSNRSCKYHSAWTEISGEHDGLKYSHRIFVPNGYAVEIWTFRAMNKTAKRKRLSLFAYAGFELTGSNAEGKPVCKDNYAEVIPDIKGVLVTNRDLTAAESPFKGFLSTLGSFEKGNGDKSHFLQDTTSTGTPKILKGYDCDNRSGYGPDCAAIVQASLELEPGTERQIDFVIGRPESIKDAVRILAALTPETIERLLAERIREAETETARLGVDTGDTGRDSLFNFFIAKQIRFGAHEKFSSSSRFENCVALYGSDPALAERSFIETLSCQREDGAFIEAPNPRQGQSNFVTPAWSMIAAERLVLETGSQDLLMKTCGWFGSEKRDPVWTHLLRGLNFFLDYPAKKNPATEITDSMSIMDVPSSRENTMEFSHASMGLRSMAVLAEIMQDSHSKTVALERSEVLKNRINGLGWAGNGYANFLSQDRSSNPEEHISLEAQVWAIVTRVAPEERARFCLETADNKMKSASGFHSVLSPYQKIDPANSVISSIMPGHSLNGGCVTRLSALKGIGDCMLGRSENAWRTLNRILPGNPDNPVSHSGAELFSIPDQYSGVIYIKGEAGQPWESQSAQWTMILLVEWILGVKPGMKGLLIDPCMPKELMTASVRRAFRNAIYDINLDNTSGRCRGLTSLKVDGAVCQDGIVPDFKSGRHRVEAVI